LPNDERIERILRIVEALRMVMGSSSDPFNIDVKAQVETLRKLLPEWKELEEILMDVEALNLLSRIVELQEKWVRYQASSLYVDPLLVELKIVTSDPERLAEIFAGSWHPILKVEQVSKSELMRAVNYWNVLLPLGERYREELGQERGLASLDVKNLVEMKVLTEEELNRRIEDVYLELSSVLEQQGRVDYWKFIKGKDLNETVARAVMLSHVISSGLASLDIKPLEENIFIVKHNADKYPKSMAIAIPTTRSEKKE
jgi:hypothetical protein